MKLLSYQISKLLYIHTYCIHVSCLRSVPHRTIKLFFIGNGERGKTTLLRRLRGLPDEKTGRTEGIEIEDWHYPEPSRFSFSAAKLPVHFLAWDFAGQVQCLVMDFLYSVHLGLDWKPIIVQNPIHVVFIIRDNLCKSLLTSLCKDHKATLLSGNVIT